MSQRFKIYLDTSVINFLFADDAPELKVYTEDFFENFVRTAIYETYASAFVIDEIQQTKDEQKKKTLLNVVEEYQIELLPVTNVTELENLAQQYIFHGVIPPKKLYDAYHIACSVLHQIDYLVSWNFKHLANVNREKRIIAVNTENDYTYPLRIITPLELIDYGN
jgi:predicted nucleic acid-binding protein